MSGASTNRERFPVNRGRIDAGRVVIENCVVCGSTHYHGPAGFVDGESTRVPHCTVPNDERPSEYRIVLEETDA